VLAGPDGQAWEIPPVPVEPLPAVDLRRVRVAFSDTFAGVPVTQETRHALAQMAQNLAGAGAQVEQCFPNEFDLIAAWETWGEVYQAEVGSSLPPEVEAEQAGASGARADAAAGEERGRARAVGASMRQYTAALNRRDALIGALERFLADWDVLLCPVVPTPAFAHGSIGAPIAVDNELVDYSVAGGAYCTPFSLTGHPVVVVPVTRAANGLPIGVQVIGPRWRDMRLVAIAAALTQVVGSIRDPPFKMPHWAPAAGDTRRDLCA
jgi:amidase